MSEKQDAEKLYRAYHGEDPTSLEMLEIPETAMVLGVIDDITYTVIDDGEEVTYHHEFEDRPTLAVSSDGRNIFILRGEWKFTERGIIG